MIGLSIVVCGASLLALIWLLRQSGSSFGLPIAYLGLLLLNHVPGAYAHLVAHGVLGPDEFTEIGIGYTALGTVAFVIGVGIARIGLPRRVSEFADRRTFAAFCLIGGWFMAYGLRGLQSVPSLGAAIEKGAAIWILAVLLGLRFALSRNSWRGTLLWLAALAVYPASMAVTEGFLSYGTAAVFTACAVLAVSARTGWRAAGGVLLVAVVSLSLFISYFGNRDTMRAAVWGHKDLAGRIEANLGMFTNFQVFDKDNPSHLLALDDRLNQNNFIGMAAKRLSGGQVSYLHGRSVSDALLSLVPRAVWPEKPVYGGSPAIVSEMTGLRLNQSTSFGVGQVMEFHINFGVPGIIVGFLLLGGLVGLLDLKAAAAEARGDLGATILFFLPGAALIQPIGSLVELSGGAAAALVAALAWRWLWTHARVSAARTRASPGRVLKVAARPPPAGP